MDLIWLIPFCIGAYFIGNINFSVFLSRRIKKCDVRKMGSGNAGATNMLRQFGTKWGIMILTLDVLKGLIPALVGYLVYGVGTNDGYIALYSMGLAAVVGHCFPVLLKFKGGKGVATIVGVFLVVNPILALIAFAAAVGYAMIWEYGAVSSFIFVTTLVVAQSITQGASLTITLLLFSFYILVCITHRKNIYRLLIGAESRASILKSIKKKKFEKKKQEWLEEEESQTI